MALARTAVRRLPHARPPNALRAAPPAAAGAGAAAPPLPPPPATPEPVSVAGCAVAVLMVALIADASSGGVDMLFLLPLSRSLWGAPSPSHRLRARSAAPIDFCVGGVQLRNRQTAFGWAMFPMRSSVGGARGRSSTCRVCSQGDQARGRPCERASAELGDFAQDGALACGTQDAKFSSHPPIDCAVHDSSGQSSLLTAFFYW